MKKKLTTIKLGLLLVVLLLLNQGCLGQQSTVKLMSEQDVPIICSQVQGMDLNTISDQDLIFVLDNTWYENENACWQAVVKKALEQDRQIPMMHLARAIHAFNSNTNKKWFSKAAYQYFTGIVQGKASYQDKDKNLMKAWMGFEIQEAQSKYDDRLTQAKRVCQRLDYDLYRRLFL